MNPDMLKDVVQRDFAKEFLKTFNETPVIENEQEFIESLTRFQKRNDLPVTGLLDVKTSAEMLRPRCGVADNHLIGAATEVWKWQNIKDGYYEILYYIHPELQEALKLPAEDFNLIMRSSFEYAWCQHTNLNIRRTNMPVTQYGLNVYGARLDGPSSILAQCELPVDGRRACRMDIDVTENWQKDIKPDAIGILLGNVVKHELGHGIGLPHSRVKSALMAAIYSEKVTDPVLNDDIPRAQYRYSSSKPRSSPLNPTPTNPTTPSNPSTPFLDRNIAQISVTYKDGQKQTFNML